MGWEHLLFTSAVWTGAADRAKFVVTLFHGQWRESAPDFLSALPYRDLRLGDDFESKYLNVLRQLTGGTEKATAPP